MQGKRSTTTYGIVLGHCWPRCLDPLGPDELQACGRTHQVLHSPSGISSGRRGGGNGLLFLTILKIVRGKAPWSGGRLRLSLRPICVDMWQMNEHAMNTYREATHWHKSVCCLMRQLGFRASLQVQLLGHRQPQPNDISAHDPRDDSPWWSSSLAARDDLLSPKHVVLA